MTGDADTDKRGVKVRDAQESISLTAPAGAEAVDSARAESAPPDRQRPSPPAADSASESSPPSVDPLQAGPSPADDPPRMGSPLEGSSQTGLPLSTKEMTLEALQPQSLVAPYRGMMRHRLIVVGCALLSLAFLIPSVVDLKFLTERDVNLDSSLNITDSTKSPELPINLSYTNLSYSYYGSSQGDLHDGLYAVEELSWSGKLQGFVDQSGKIAIKPQFKRVQSFQDGYAVVEDQSTGKTGVIDRTGNYVVQPQFDEIRAFEHGVGIAEIAGKGAGLIDKTGRLILPLNSEYSIERIGHAFVVRKYSSKNGTGVALLSEAGKWLTPFKYENISPFERRDFPPFIGSPVRNFDIDRTFEIANQGVLKVSKSGRGGLIDFSGREIIPPAHAYIDAIDSYKNGHAAVSVNQKYGFVDSNNKFVIPPKYDEVTAYDDLIAVRNGERWSLINRKGEVVQAPEIKQIFRLNNGDWLSSGMGAFFDGEKFGYVDRYGQVVIKPQFDLVLPFEGNHAPVWIGDAWQFIDKSGRVVAGLPKFAKITIFFGGKSQATIAGPFSYVTNAFEIKRIREYIKNFKQRVDYPFKQRIGPY